MPWRRTLVRGLIAAPFTPMRSDGTINLAIIERLAASLIADGVAGAFVCGTTGESMSLTVSERKAVAAEWVKAAGDKLQIIVHVGHTCLPDAQELARHAQEIGAHAIAAMAPFFFRPAQAEDLADFCRELAAAAPELPFFYYHIPSMTGVQVPVPEFLQAAADIPTLAGVKFTSENLMEFSQCLRLYDGRFHMLFGRDEILLAGLSMGAPGAVGSTYNFAAPVYQRMWRAYAAGDMETARAEQAFAADVVKTFIPYGALAAQKAMMKMIGLDCGPVRPPLRSLSPAQYSRLQDELEKMGFFESCHRG